MIARIQATVEFAVTLPDSDPEGEEIDLADLEACLAEGVDDFLFGNMALETQGTPSITADVVETGEE